MFWANVPCFRIVSDSGESSVQPSGSWRVGEEAEKSRVSFDVRSSKSWEDPRRWILLASVHYYYSRLVSRSEGLPQAIVRGLETATVRFGLAKSVIMCVSV